MSTSKKLTESYRDIENFEEFLNQLFTKDAADDNYACSDAVKYIQSNAKAVDVALDFLLKQKSRSYTFEDYKKASTATQEAIGCVVIMVSQQLAPHQAPRFAELITWDIILRDKNAKGLIDYCVSALGRVGTREEISELREFLEHRKTCVKYRRNETHGLPPKWFRQRDEDLINRAIEMIEKRHPA